MPNSNILFYISFKFVVVWWIYTVVWCIYTVVQTTTVRTRKLWFINLTLKQNLSVFEVVTKHQVVLLTY